MSIKFLNSEILTAANKATPIDNDSAIIVDSADSSIVKASTWTQIKAFLKTYFDTIYDVIRTIATGAEIDTGTDDAKFVTSKAINDSHNVPDVAPGTTGNYMKSDGTDWTSAAFPAIPVKATGAEIDTGTDDAKFVTSKAIADAKIVKAPASSTDGHVALFDGVSGKLLKDGGAAGSGDMVLASTQTVSGAKSFNDAMLKLNGSSSGATTLKAPAAAGTDITVLPAIGGTDTLVALAVAQTLTAKRVQKRVYSTTDAASLTPEIDTYDIFIFTALAQSFTINNHSSSTPVNGERMEIRLYSASAQTIAWGNKYYAMQDAKPTATPPGKWLAMLFEYFADGNWYLMTVNTQA